MEEKKGYNSDELVVDDDQWEMMAAQIRGDSPEEREEGLSGVPSDGDASAPVVPDVPVGKPMPSSAVRAGRNGARRQGKEHKVGAEVKPAKVRDGRGVMDGKLYIYIPSDLRLKLKCLSLREGVCLSEFVRNVLEERVLSESEFLEGMMRHLRK